MVAVLVPGTWYLVGHAQVYILAVHDTSTRHCVIPIRHTSQCDDFESVYLKVSNSRNCSEVICAISSIINPSDRSSLIYHFLTFDLSTALVEWYM
jgi:hypothetical protein